ncbi:MAG: hypothetical protein WCP28_18825, partial [Actinomycetes bacterium]
LDHGSDGARELRGKNRIGLWVKLLALGLARPDTRWQGILVGTDHRPRDKGSQPGPLMLRLSLPENPGQVLSRILELYDRGMRQPLPLYCDTSAAYADAVRFANPHKRMANTWVTGFDSPKEDQDAYNLRVLDPMPTVEDLLADPQFVACGHELWDDLLAHEQVLSQAQLEADQAVAP